MSSRANNPRAEASRRHGAKSKGPITAGGKRRASKNALKRSLRAEDIVLLVNEDREAFDELDPGT
ncbi:MAG: hypothetical protein ACRBM6_08670 [Geminicoccales bacterium]